MTKKLTISFSLLLLLSTVELSALKLIVEPKDAPPEAELQYTFTINRGHSVDSETLKVSKEKSTSLFLGGNPEIQNVELSWKEFNHKHKVKCDIPSPTLKVKTLTYETLGSGLPGMPYECIMQVEH